MALIEYDIQYVKGKSTVTYKVLEVDKGDRIRFKSTYPEVAIQYQKRSPFTNPKAPKANQPFQVKGTTADFKITKRLTAATRIHFACGELASAIAPGQTKPSTAPRLEPWPGENGGEGGNGTPPDF